MMHNPYAPPAPRQRFVSQLWRWLIQPVKPTQMADSRSDLLSLLILLLIPSMLTGGVWNGSWISGPGFQVYVVVGAMILSITYVLNRLGNYRFASLLTVGSLFSFPFAGLIFDVEPNPVRVIIILMCSLPTVLVGYLVFSLRGVVAVCLLNLAALSLSPLLFGRTIDPAVAIFPISFVASLSFLIVIAAIVRQRDQMAIAQQQRALIESETRFRDLFEAAFEAMAVIDHDKVIDANPAFAELVKMPLLDVIGASLRPYIHSDDFDRVIREYRSGTGGLMEFRMVTRDGTVINVEARGKKHRYRGALQRVIGIRDITLSKQSEARQVELAVEREKVRVLQRFISNMSHDLRTPLTVIKTGVYLLKRMKYDPEQQAAQLEVLTAQVESLQRLLDDLLSMSKLDKADTSDYRFKWLNINLPTSQAVDDEQRLAKRRSQTLNFEPGENLPDVLIDQYEFKRMVKHLILNAIGCTPENGTITISTRTANKEIHVAVQDSGEGISPLELPYIFERFYHHDLAKGTPDGGTGLSLNIARKIAEAHGGMIDVQSAIGQGSTFTVRLPILSETDALNLFGNLPKETNDRE